MATSTARGHCGALQHLAIVVDGFDKDLVLGNGQVIEAVLGLAVPMRAIPWRGFTRDASAAARDDAHHTAQRSPIGSQLLVVSMPCDQEIQSKSGVEGAVPPGVMAAGEVGHHDLPIRLGVRQLALNPRFLLGIEAPKPSLAGVDRGGAAGGGATGIGAVVLATAHVVLRV